MITYNCIITIITQSEINGSNYSEENKKEISFEVA